MFYRKTLGCFGDGGAVVTNDEDIAAKIFQLQITAAIWKQARLRCLEGMVA